MESDSQSLVRAVNSKTSLNYSHGVTLGEIVDWFLYSQFLDIDYVHGSTNLIIHFLVSHQRTPILFINEVPFPFKTK